MANLNVEVILLDVRLSHPQLFNARSYKDDPKLPKKFQASFIMDLKTESGKANHRKLQAAKKEVMLATFGPDEKKWPNFKEDHNCFKKYPDEENIAEELRGNSVFSGKNTRRPQVLDGRKNPVMEQDGVIYAGCYVNGIVRMYAQTGDNLGLRGSVETVQFWRKGDAFGPGPVDTSVLPDAPDDPNDALGDNSDAGGDDLDI